MAVFWTHDNKPVHIDSMYKGQSVFLTCSGPSLATVDLDSLRHPGIVTLGCNNSPVVFRPNLWTMVDDVKNFCMSIYQDPSILKFLPQPKHKHKLWDNNRWSESSVSVHDCPGVMYYKRRSDRGDDGEGGAEWFRAQTFFSDECFCWGSHKDRCFCGRYGRGAGNVCPKCGHKDRGGSRTVFLVMLRLAVELGFRNLYLVGADFRMDEGAQNYAWPQARARGSVRNNNSTYRMLNLRMDALKPELERRGIHIHNCTEGSGLETFPYMPLHEAVERALEWMPEHEQTDGLYDRKANDGRKPNQTNKPRVKWLHKPKQHQRQLTLRDFVAAS